MLLRSCKLRKSCETLAKNSILPRFLYAMEFKQESCKKLFNCMNLAKNALVSSEDVPICWPQLTMILNFRFTKVSKTFEIGNLCSLSTTLFQCRVGVSLIAMVFKFFVFNGVFTVKEQIRSVGHVIIVSDFLK